MNNERLITSQQLVRSTLDSLQSAGTLEKEGVVLWLGRRDKPGEVHVVELYVPEHEAEDDYFRIPPESMRSLLQYLRETGTFIASQVHSHPHHAFHSAADNRWAIVRHLGALSLVVPSFARNTDVETFIGDIAAFRLNGRNMWEELSVDDRAATIIL